MSPLTRRGLLKGVAGSTLALAYDWYAGTSMAAPQVAGLVALIREVAPEMSAKKVQNVVERTARYSAGNTRNEMS